VSARDDSILEAIGDTPLVRLQHLGAGLKQPILVKCEHLNPGGSVKDRIALAIVDDAERRGLLLPGATLIEATAGNTGVGLALVAAVRGYDLVCVMPEKMSVDKRAALRRMGARVIVTPNAPPSSPDNFQNVARQMAGKHGWYLTDQFNNPANIEAHLATGQELLDQVGGPIGAFVSGAGTGGTITGVGRRLKESDPRCQIVLADPVGSGLANWVATGELGPDGPYAIEGIGSSKVPGNLDRSVIDSAESVTDAESFQAVADLVRYEGMHVGGSAGANLAAALRVAAREDLVGPVITVMCDSWDRYFAQPWMTTVLDAPKAPSQLGDER